MKCQTKITIMRTLICILVATILVIISCFVGICFPNISHAYSESKQILVIQHQKLITYDQIFTGFLASIDKQKYIITKYNAHGNLNALDIFTDSLINQTDYDLIISLGTLGTKNIIKKEKNTPILFSGLSSPEYSGLIDNWDQSSSNYSGAEIRNQTYNSLKYIHNLINFDSIGFVYLIGDPSHEGCLAEIKQIGHEAGFFVYASGIYNRDVHGKKLPNEIISKCIKNKVECITNKTNTFYVNLSRTFLDNFESFNNIFIKKNILSIGNNIYIEKGLVIGISSNVYEKGKILADYTEKILFKNIDIGSLRMDIIPKFEIEYNMKSAKKITFNPNIHFMLNVTNIQTELN